MSLVRNLLAGILGLGSKRKRRGDTGTLRGNRAAAKPGLWLRQECLSSGQWAPPALWSQLVPLWGGWRSLKSSHPSRAGKREG